MQIHNVLILAVCVQTCNLCVSLSFKRKTENGLISDTKYGMKSDNFMYFKLTIHPVYIGDYKKRKKETRDVKRKLTYS